MADLKKIQGVGESEAELLGATGVEKVSTLAESDPSGLLEEMEQANAQLKLVDSLPDLDKVIAWIEAARKIEGHEGPPLVKRLDEVIELVPIEVLSAFPVKKESITKNRIAVGDVPVMEEFLEESELFEEQVRSVDSPAVAPASTSLREISAKPKPRVANQPIDESVAEENAKRTVVEPLKRNAGFDIRKTASPKLNEGKKLHSRSYIRGVLHPQPGRVKLASLITAITFFLFPLNFVAGIVLLQIKGHDYAIWLAIVPASFFVFGMAYLVFCRPVKCRICGQPVFSPKACGRHKKSHRLPMLGFILPACLHILLFHWFRCMYCGTSIRLKE